MSTSSTITINLLFRADYTKVVQQLKRFAKITDSLVADTRGMNDRLRAVFARQEKAIRSASIQVEKLRQRVKKTGADPAILGRTVRSFNKLKDTMKAGALSAENYARATDRFADVLARANLAVDKHINDLKKLNQSAEAIQVDDLAKAMLKRRKLFIESIERTTGETRKRLLQQQKVLRDAFNAMRQQIFEFNKLQMSPRFAKETVLAFKQLRQQLMAGPLQKETIDVLGNEFKSTLKRIRTDAIGFQKSVLLGERSGLMQIAERLSEAAKSIQIALGPLSGVAARFTAFVSLMTRTNLVIAATISALIGMGAALTFATRSTILLEQEITSLGALVASRGLRAWSEMRESLDETARALGYMTLAASEAAYSIARIIMMAENIPIIKEMSEAIIFAAQGMQMIGGGTVETSARRLAKILDDPLSNLEALKESGIQFTEAQKQMIRMLVISGDLFKAQTLILKRLVPATAAAIAEAASLAGAFDSLIEKIKEISRALVIPTGVAQAITQITEQITILLDQVARRTGVINLIGNTATIILLTVNGLLAALNAVLSIVPSTVLKVVSAFIAFQLVATTLSKILRTGIGIDIIRRLAIAAAVNVMALVKALKSINAVMIAGVLARLSNLANILASLTRIKGIIIAVTTVLLLMTLPLSKLLDFLLSWLPEGVARTIKSFIGMEDMSDRFARSTQKAMQTIAAQIIKLNKAMEDLPLEERLVEITSAVGRLLREAGKERDTLPIIDALNDLQVKIELTAKQVPELWSILERQFGITARNFDAFMTMIRASMSPLERTIMDVRREIAGIQEQADVIDVRLMFGIPDEAKVAEIVEFMNNVRERVEELNLVPDPDRQLAFMDSILKGLKALLADQQDITQRTWDTIENMITTKLISITGATGMARTRIMELVRSFRILREETQRLRFAETLAKGIEQLNKEYDKMLDIVVRTTGFDELAVSMERTRIEMELLSKEAQSLSDARKEEIRSLAESIAVRRLANQMMQLTTEAMNTAASQVKQSSLEVMTLDVNLTDLQKTIKSMLPTLSRLGLTAEDVFELMTKATDVDEFSKRLGRMLAEATAMPIDDIERAVERLTKALTDTLNDTLNKNLLTSVEAIREVKREIKELERQIREVERGAVPLDLTDPRIEAMSDRMKALFTSLLRRRDELNAMLDKTLQSVRMNTSAFSELIGTITDNLSEAEKTGLRFLEKLASANIVDLEQAMNILGSTTEYTIGNMKDFIAELERMGLITPFIAEQLTQLAERMQQVGIEKLKRQLEESMDFMTDRLKAVKERAEAFELGITKEQLDRFREAERIMSELVKFGAMATEAMKQSLSDMLDAMQKVNSTEMNLMLDVAEGVKSALTKAGQNISSALMEGRSTMEVMKQLAMDISKAIIDAMIQRAIVEPLVGAIDVFARNMFASGAGSAWVGGVRKMQTGGIISTPTLMMSKGGPVLAGEIGTEAILPLERRGGILGVRAYGGGAGSLTVRLVDDTGLGLEQAFAVQDGSEGPELHILIGELVNKLMLQGRFDDALMQRSAVIQGGT